MRIGSARPLIRLCVAVPLLRLALMLVLRWQLLLVAFYATDIASQGADLMDSIGGNVGEPAILPAGDPRIPPAIRALGFVPWVHAWRDHLFIRGAFGAVIVYRQPHRARRHEWRMNDRVFWSDPSYEQSPE